MCGLVQRFRVPVPALVMDTQHVSSEIKCISLEATNKEWVHMHSFMHWFTHSLTHSPTLQLIHPSIHPSIHASIHPSIHSFIHSFICYKLFFLIFSISLSHFIEQWFRKTNSNNHYLSPHWKEKTNKSSLFFLLILFYRLINSPMRFMFWTWNRCSGLYLKCR